MLMGLLLKDTISSVIENYVLTFTLAAQTICKKKIRKERNPSIYPLSSCKENLTVSKDTKRK